MERYRPIVGDFSRFEESLLKPLPKVIWCNPLRGLHSDEWVKERCPEAEPLDWAKRAWRIPPKTPVGTWIEHKLGIIHVQEEVTLWPADLVGAKPGERVLDLCAAPGNKTARMATNMNNEGFIYANEKRWQRASSLRFNLDRLGVTCVGLGIGDGREVSLPEEWFDRALVDVPCSGEGMVRKQKGWCRPTSDNERAGLVGTQKGILRKAVESVRPGGTLVYATCTFAPEENEGVVDWGLRHLPIEMVSLEPPLSMVVSPGLTHWKDQGFHETMTEAGRFWPHENDTGGFFVANLRRI